MGAQPVQVIKGRVIRTIEAWRPLESALTRALGRHTESERAGRAYDALLDMHTGEFHHMLRVVVQSLESSGIRLVHVESVDDNEE